MSPDDAMPSLPATAGSRRLVPLRTLSDFRLSADEPDVHGWDVRTEDGTRLGAVGELLVDAATAEVGALVVDAVDGGSLVLPMERAWLDERRRAVACDLTLDELRTLPRTTGDADTDAPAEPSAAASFADLAGHPGVTVSREGDEDVIRVPIVHEELVVERRPVVKEVVVIRKRARTEQRVVEADLRRERLVVDRHDAPDARSDMRADAPPPRREA